MYLLSYCFKENQKWDIQEINFQDLNLIVGRTGSGKTRFINTFIHFSEFFKSKNNEVMSGKWIIKFKLDKKQPEIYEYTLDVDDNKKIVEEKLCKNNDVVFTFNGESACINGQNIDGLNPKSLVLKTFSGKQNFSEIILHFQNVFLRRHNPGSDNPNILVSMQQLSLLDSKEKASDVMRKNNLISLEVGFYLLKIYDPKGFEKFKQIFTDNFPYVKDIDLLPINQIPEINISEYINKEQLYCLCIKESGKWISRLEISSGMLRHIEALIDIFVAPQNSIIIYDEFENGLDPFIIGSLFDIYLEKLFDHQFIFTSHHPYLIDRVSPKNWIVFNRKGYTIKNFLGTIIGDDSDLSGNFIALLNTPEYKD